jgi:aryl-alcohol dehydrogenase-like predicted oxidoreductase
MPKNDYLKKTAIGTVQFGLNYGISNNAGQTSTQEVGAILDLAAENQIFTLDTAKLYGQSELIIGQVKASRMFNVITKTSKFENARNALKHLKKDFIKSSLNLKQKPYGLLFHDQNDLLLDDSDKIFDQALELKSENKVHKIGVSVYDPDSAEIIINNFNIDIIQLPLNIYDQRFMTSGLLKELKAREIEVHTRSTFLQGLLLMNDLPSYFESIKSHHQAFIKYCNTQNKTPLEMALEFVFCNSDVDKVVLGINNSSQLQEIISLINSIDSDELNYNFLSSLAINDQKIINPGYWNHA